MSDQTDRAHEPYTSHWHCVYASQASTIETRKFWNMRSDSRLSVEWANCIVGEDMRE